MAFPICDLLVAIAPPVLDYLDISLYRWGRGGGGEARILSRNECFSLSLFQMRGSMA